MTEPPRSGQLRDLLVVFGTLGVIGFGGPAAHIALMRREVVERRRWLTDQQMVDLVGITNLIPGPNSTEMSMHVGRLRAGGIGLRRGAVVGAHPVGRARGRERRDRAGGTRDRNRPLTSR